MVHRFSVFCFCWDGHWTGRKELVVPCSVLAPAFVPLVQTLELDAQDGSLQGVEPTVIAERFVMIFLALTVVAQHPQRSIDTFIVSDRYAAVSTST